MDRTRLSLVLLTGLWCNMPQAGQADVVRAQIHTAADGTCTVSATVRHADTGWEHYADRWEVVGPDGEVLATRKLWHPHVDEQPFTRSLSGVQIPPQFGHVSVRAGDSRHGLGGREVTLEVPR